MSDSLENGWHRVCATADVNDGELKRFQAGEIAVVVVGVGDEYRIIPPFCPHMAEPLHESGICRAGTLTCSKHLWQWNLLTGKEQGPAERPLLFYQSEVRDGEVWACVDKELVYEFDEEDDDDFEW
ncbi:MAG: (2Fe-2S)-binding protein [Candidatus Thioglobus sp.]|jgi:toluene monooxygenase system ferredoxin subunit|nr:MAG: (2Fe-2S)-binding protein [Candidatus Thioglobus sp.]|tara:strand:- start:158 stop:535 length:378 start_codon:yes stop_codon:yes gene_type:complete